MKSRRRRGISFPAGINIDRWWSESMDMLLAEVGVRCDRCGTSFVSRQLPTFIDIGHRNSELRQDYRGYQPMMEQYAIISCPSCGRADWSTAFPPVPGTPVLTQASTSAHMQYRQAALDK